MIDAYFSETLVMFSCFSSCLCLWFTCISNWQHVLLVFSLWCSQCFERLERGSVSLWFCMKIWSTKVDLLVLLERNTDILILNQLTAVQAWQPAICQSQPLVTDTWWCRFRD